MRCMPSTARRCHCPSTPAAVQSTENLGRSRGGVTPRRRGARGTHPVVALVAWELIGGATATSSDVPSLHSRCTSGVAGLPMAAVALAADPSALAQLAEIS